MVRNLSQVPNYTCLQTIERSQRPSPKQKFQPLDKVRLEVALVGGKELYSWPGAGRFEEKGLDSFLGGGTTSTGDYALHARSVFESRAPTFSFAGEEDLDRRPAIRFDYDVTLAKSDYMVRSGDNQARVPYRGSFWVDRETLDLLRLDVVVDTIPPDIDITQASTEIRYGNVRVGESDFLLPRQVDLVLRISNGAERHNLTEFTRCRQYVGESSILFDDPAPATSAISDASEVELPAGLSFDLRLKDPVNLRTAVIGDQLTATLVSAVKRDGRIALPKGAIFHARIRQLSKMRDCIAVGIELFEARFEHTRAPVFARLEQAGPIQSGASRSLVLIPQETEKGIGAFMVQTARYPSLPAGLRMVWITLPTVK